MRLIEIATNNLKKLNNSTPCLNLREDTRLCETVNENFFDITLEEESNLSNTFYIQFDDIENSEIDYIVDLSFDKLFQGFDYENNIKLDKDSFKWYYRLDGKLIGVIYYDNNL